MSTPFALLTLCCFLHTSSYSVGHQIVIHNSEKDGETVKRISPKTIQNRLTSKLTFVSERELPNQKRRLNPTDISSSALHLARKKFNTRLNHNHNTTPTKAKTYNNDIQIATQGNINEKTNRNKNVRKSDNDDNRKSFLRNLLRHRAGSGAKEVTVDECDKSYLDGCSIPFGLPFFFKEHFTPSCFRHDVCYRCGVDYGFNRYECDEEFRFNMIDSCSVFYIKGNFNNDSNYNKHHHKGHSTSYQNIRELGGKFESPGNKTTNLLYKHKQLVVTTVKSLRPQFDGILKEKLSAFVYPSSRTRFTKTHKLKFSKLEFLQHADSIKFQVIKEWHKLLHRTISSTGKTQELHSSGRSYQSLIESQVIGSVWDNGMPSLELRKYSVNDDSDNNSDNHDNNKNHGSNNKTKITKSIPKKKSYPILPGFVDIAQNHVNILPTSNFFHSLCENISKQKQQIKDVVSALCQEILDDILSPYNQQDKWALSSNKPMWQDFPDLLEYFLCQFFSEMYYWGVRFFGGPSYQDTARDFCGESYVPNCLPDDGN